MRRTLVLLTFLAAGAARGQDLQPAYAPLKLVAIMHDTQQVMLWNESAGEYQLARVGDEVEDWRIVAVMPDARRIVVVRSGMRDELSLSELPRARAGASADPRQPRMAPIIISETCPTAPAAASVNPYASPAPSPAPAPGAPYAPAPGAPYAPTPAPAPGMYAPAPAPVNPYAAPAPTPYAAPVNPYASPTPPPYVAPTPVNPYPAPGPQPAAPPPQPAAEPPPATEPPPPVEMHVLARAELNRELRDFDRLLAGLTVAGAQGGGFTLARLDPKSWVHKIGLRQGDVVRSVAGESVSTLEEAARVYARLGTLDNFLVVVERGPQKLLLSYTVK